MTAKDVDELLKGFLEPQKKKRLTVYTRGRCCLKGNLVDYSTEGLTLNTVEGDTYVFLRDISTIAVGSRQPTKKKDPP